MNSHYVTKLPAPPILHGRAIVELWCDWLQKYLLKKWLKWWVTSRVNIYACVCVQSEQTLAQQQKFTRDVADSVWCASKPRCCFFSKVLHTGGVVMPFNSPERHHFNHIHSLDWHISATVPFKTNSLSVRCVWCVLQPSLTQHYLMRSVEFHCQPSLNFAERRGSFHSLYPSLSFSSPFYLPSLNFFHFSFLAASFPVFKPEELRQALMPTLEALYRQDPESLPFRQPVDPQLLGIPVRIRTSNKTNLVRDCTGCHFASTLLKT